MSLDENEYLKRFQQALSLLCSQEPTLELCGAWLSFESEELQYWAIEHSVIPWAQGIGVIEAAQHLANNPAEGEDHTGFLSDFQPKEDSLLSKILVFGSDCARSRKTATKSESLQAILRELNAPIPNKDYPIPEDNSFWKHRKGGIYKVTGNFRSRAW